MNDKTIPQTTINQSIKESGVIAQKAIFKGTIVAGRDIHLTDTPIVTSKNRFSEINLHPYKKEVYIAPLFTNLLFNHLKEKRLLVIGGSFEFYRNDFIRHLATLIVEETGIRAKEWIEKAGNFNLFSSLSEEEESTVFLFPSTTPQEVNYDLRRLGDIAVKYNHYIIVGTNHSAFSWKLPIDIKTDYWFEIPQNHIYDLDDLIGCLIKELKEADKQIRFEKKFNTIDSETEVVDGIRLEDLACKLETIDKIQIFVRLLINEGKVITFPILSQLLKKVTDSKSELITTWFMALNEKEKETAIALSLFDGLFDDQFFEATERIVDQAWQRRETKLRSLDYCDLDGLLNFFNVKQIDFNHRLIDGKFPRQRLEFFKAIWFSHRRQLLAALSVLEELIKSADSIEAYSWELYGSSERKERLLKAVSEVLSDLGMLHLHVVEPHLLRLATHPKVFIQEITAKALARWREFGKENQLFDTLERWQKEKHVLERIEYFSQPFLKQEDDKTLVHREEDEIGDKEDKKKEQKTEEEPKMVHIPAETIVRATNALIIAFASDYDQSNQLSKKLIRLFLNFIEETNHYVRLRYRAVTVPKVVSNHLWQLKDDLLKIVRHGDLVHSVALGIARAYEKFPDHVEKVIGEWLNYIRKFPEYRSIGNKISHRDSVLITIVLALAEIRYSNKNPFNAKSAYSIIVELQKEEYHQAIEKFYFHFVLKQLDVHTSEVDPAILNIIEKLSLKRHSALMDSFTDIYLNQRVALKGGEIIYDKKDGMAFPVWLNGDRPLTEIERTMIQWLLEDSATGQQIAMEALYRFSEALDEHEEKFIQEYLEYGQQNKELNKSKAVSEKPEPVITVWSNNWISFLIGLFTLRKYAAEIKTILKNILPVLIRKKLTSPTNLNVIARKLNKYGKLESTSLAGYVSKFAQYFINFWWWLSIVGIVIAIVLYLLISGMWGF